MFEMNQASVALRKAAKAKAHSKPVGFELYGDGGAIIHLKDGSTVKVTRRDIEDQVDLPPEGGNFSNWQYGDYSRW